MLVAARTLGCAKFVPVYGIEGFTAQYDFYLALEPEQRELEQVLAASEHARLQSIRIRFALSQDSC